MLSPGDQHGAGIAGEVGFDVHEPRFDIGPWARTSRPWEFYSGLLTRRCRTRRCSTQFDADPRLKPRGDDRADQRRHRQRQPRRSGCDLLPRPRSLRRQRQFRRSNWTSPTDRGIVTQDRRHHLRRYIYPNNGAVDPDKTIAAIRVGLGGGNELGHETGRRSAATPGRSTLQLVWTIP